MEYKDFSGELDLDAVSFVLEELSTSEPFNEPDTFWALIDMYICVDDHSIFCLSLPL